MILALEHECQACTEWTQVQQEEAGQNKFFNPAGCSGQNSRQTRAGKIQGQKIQTSYIQDETKQGTQGSLYIKANTPFSVEKWFKYTGEEDTDETNKGNHSGGKTRIQLDNKHKMTQRCYVAKKSLAVPRIAENKQEHVSLWIPRCSKALCYHPPLPAMSLFSLQSQSDLSLHCIFWFIQGAVV